MATNRTRRLRKKLCVDEFQELGFELTVEFKEGTDVDAYLDAFLSDAIDANGLDYIGADDYGIVCLGKRGSVTAEQREAVQGWLQGRAELAKCEVGPMMDVWYPEKALNAPAA